MGELLCPRLGAKWRGEDGEKIAIRRVGRIKDVGNHLHATPEPVDGVVMVGDDPAEPRLEAVRRLNDGTPEEIALPPKCQ